MSRFSFNPSPHPSLPPRSSSHARTTCASARSTRPWTLDLRSPKPIKTPETPDNLRWEKSGKKLGKK
eukprot:2011556-Amphidinium_carterae.1